jgi:hypothetical protein
MIVFLTESGNGQLQQARHRATGGGLRAGLMEPACAAR